jgi:DnaK suppressor protein
MKNNLTNWSEDRESLKREPYMSPKMLAYFQEKLVNWRNQIVEEIDEEAALIQNQVPDNSGDIADKGTDEASKLVEFSNVNRHQVLLESIDRALARIHNKSYGYCLETNKPIGFERLDAWPIAELSFELQKNEEDPHHSF